MDYLFFNVQLDYTIDESNLTKYFHPSLTVTEYINAEIS